MDDTAGCAEGKQEQIEEDMMNLDVFELSFSIKKFHLQILKSADEILRVFVKSKATLLEVSIVEKMGEKAVRIEEERNRIGQDLEQP